MRLQKSTSNLLPREKRLLQFEPDIFLEALPIVNKGWKLGDALHYLTMVKHNIGEIVTDDGHFDNVEGITRIDLLQ